MLVRTILHGRAVLARYASIWKITKRRYLVFDYETKAMEGFDKDDALIFGRCEVLIMSVCYQGEAYSFIMDPFDATCPSQEEWAALLRPIFEDKTIVKVAHNANYDLNVTYTALGIKTVRNIWCTMIGGWVACEYMEKGLKDRAPVLNRLLRQTSTVDFSNLPELAEYAEGDVIATEEFYQLQNFGHVVRSPSLNHVTAYNRLEHSKNRMPAGVIKVPLQRLEPFQRTWFHRLEMPVLKATLRAERHGFPFSTKRLVKIRAKLSRKLLSLRRRIRRMAGWEVNVNSNPDMTRAFEKLGIVTERKTKKGKLSFDARSMAQIRDQHPFVDAIIGLKQNLKLGSVYIGTQNRKEGTDCGMEYYCASDGRIHCGLNTVGAVTGRFSSSNPNLQNLPNRKDIFGIRRCFTAGKPNRLLGVLDYAGLELRVMALLCKDPAMTEILSDPKGDMHAVTAERFGIDRVAAKQLNFLMQYGGKAYALAEQLTFLGIAMTEAQVDGYRNIYNKTYWRVPAYRDELVNFHEKFGFIQLFLGRIRRLPGLNFANDFDRHKAETTLSNNCVQGTGQDFLKAAMVRCDWTLTNPDRSILRENIKKRSHTLVLKDYAQRLDKYRATLKKADCRFIVQVHDEAVFVCDRSAIEECLDIWARVMSWRHFFPAISGYNVPLIVEGGAGENWQQAKSDKALHHVKRGFEEYERYK